jgi:DNA-directed RNA polymerase subunit alpha
LTLIQHFSSEQASYRSGERSVPIPIKIYNIPLVDLGLSVRAQNALRRHPGLSTVGHLLEMSEEGLRSIKNFGEKSMQEVCERLLAMGALSATLEERRSEQAISEKLI